MPQQAASGAPLPPPPQPSASSSPPPQPRPSPPPRERCLGLCSFAASASLAQPRCYGLRLAAEAAASDAARSERPTSARLPDDFRFYCLGRTTFDATGRAAAAAAGTSGRPPLPVCEGVELLIVGVAEAEAAGPPRRAPASGSSGGAAAATPPRRLSSSSAPASASGSSGGAAASGPGKVPPGLLSENGPFAGFKEKFAKVADRNLSRMQQSLGAAFEAARSLASRVGGGGSGQR